MRALEVAENPRGEPGIGQRRRADRHEGRARREVLAHVVGAPDPAHADDRRPWQPLGHPAHRQDARRQERGPARATVAVAKPRGAVLVERHAGEGVHDGDAVGAGVPRHEREPRDVGERRGELGDERAPGGPANAGDDGGDRRRIGAELQPAGGGVGAGQVELVRR